MEWVPECAFVVSIVAEPPLWAEAMTPHMELSTVPSKSVPTTPFGGVVVDVGGGVVGLVGVEDGLGVVEGGLVVVGAVVGAVPGKHCE